MAKLVTAAEVFISSPDDVAGERQALVRVIERINRLPQVRDHYVLRPFRYESVSPRAGDKPQIIVDRACHVSDCYVVICILWNRMGTPFTHPSSGKRFRSGTEYEFLTAYESLKSSETGSPLILLYRKDLTQLPLFSRMLSFRRANKSQNQLVAKFFRDYENQLTPPFGLYSRFSETHQFEEESFFHILDLLHSRPPRGESAATLPNIVEEDRRLDVATPKCVGVRQTVELWVKICQTGSSGLKKELPDNAPCPGSPSKSDTSEKFMAVAFERDEVTEKLLPLATEIEVTSNDFEIDGPRKRVELTFRNDSPTVIFQLSSKVPKDCSIVVRVKTKSSHGNYWIENCSMIRRIKVIRNLGHRSDYVVESRGIRSITTRQGDPVGAQLPYDLAPQNSIEKTRTIRNPNQEKQGMPPPPIDSPEAPTELDQERPPGVREIGDRAPVVPDYDSFPPTELEELPRTCVTDIIDIKGDDSDPKTQLVNRVSPKKSDAEAAPVDTSGLADPPVGCLLVIGGPGIGNHCVVGVGHNTIGRGGGNRVRLNFGDGSISSDKALSIFYEPKENQFFVAPGDGINLGLARLGERAILRIVELTAGDEITIGRTTLRFIPFCTDVWSWESLPSDKIR